MKNEVYERLLDNVLFSDSELELTQERMFIQAISDYKYDSYQQFIPGLRFIESLCLWLKQMNPDERILAYEFMKKKLIFYSSKEMKHLIQITYPDFIKQYLVKLTSNITNINKFQIRKILNHQKFKDLKSRSLFLGLSDGACINDFRRLSKIRHEQVYPTYLISEIKSKEFIKKLKKYLEESSLGDSIPKFEIAFLLDDFSGSGYSFLHKDDKCSDGYDGKIYRFYKSIFESPKLKDLFDLENIKICVVLYLATSRAKQRIEERCNDFFKSKSVEFSLIVIHELKDNVSIDALTDMKLTRILKKYYNPDIETPSYKKGDMTYPYLGFDGCGLPLILYHNTPNNSLSLLWMDPEQYPEQRGLFPRIERFLNE